MYKAVFFDLDGTLFNDEGKILESTIRAIQSVQKQNIIVGIATGRSKPMIAPALEKVSFDAYVLMNGGFSLHKNDLHVTFPFSEHDLGKLVERAKSHGHGLTFCGENTCYLVQNSEMMKACLDKFKAPCAEYEQNMTQDVYAIWLNCPSDEMEIYNDLGDFSINPWTGKDGMYDVMLGNVSKLEGIYRLVEKLGISIEETIAIGDGFNDIEMLKGVGLGIAMGNAPAKVKSHAKMITSSNNEDGIANAFKKLGLI